MNREIKFRAFNHVAKKMYLETKLGDVFKWQNEGQVQTIMQFTGLHDKNGKEIYEGDIIKHPLATAPEDNGWVLFWDDFGWKVKLNDEVDEYLLPLSQINIDSYEIIGNIYENPELCKP